MLIFINGTYGVGKTRVSKKLSGITGYAALNSDKMYLKMIKEDVNKALETGTQPHTNENMLKLLKDKIDKSRNKDLIIDMTIASQIAKTKIIDYFSNKHFE